MPRYDFIISGLTIQLTTPREQPVPVEFAPFLSFTEKNGKPDFSVEFIFGEMPEYDSKKYLTEKILWSYKGHPTRVEPLYSDEPLRIYVPEIIADEFCQNGRWINFLSLHRMFIRRKRIVLHSSGVIREGKAYLFSAPSGVGKSTQAALWEKYAGAEIINGDKIVISLPEKPGNVVTAHGSPIAGTSAIYRNISAPIGGIFILHRGSVPRMSQISEKEKLLSLYSESVKSIRDQKYNTLLIDNLKEIITSVPVYNFECTPDRNSVDCVIKSICL